jgi:hypothetical protein
VNSASLGQPNFRILLLSAGPLLAIMPLLAGCNPDGYSTELKYPVRTDPILTKTITKESPVPDRPGVLPALNIARLQQPIELAKPMNLYEELGGSKDVLNPNDLSGDDRSVLESTLTEMFGTPFAPQVEGPDKDIVERLVRELKLSTDTLRHGSMHYRHHCLHCHGLAGDGRGPTSFWINPHPRDYRKGIYKFVSTTVDQSPIQRPRREDLLRTLRHGIDGTAMPAFNVLSEEEQESIASYVIHLGIRGEVEESAIARLLRSKPAEREESPKETIQAELSLSAKRWLDAQKVLEPTPYPYNTPQEVEASIKRGWDIVRREDEHEKDKKPEDKLPVGNCLKCHPNYGRASIFRFDDWGTMVRPADLTAGIYRGGRRPIDLYWRINNGINGAGMLRGNLLRDNVKAKAEKTDPIWDVVNFLQVLPYPKMREKYGIQIN